MPTANLGLTLPVSHGSPDVWDAILEDVFGLIDEHDHSPGKGVKVPSAGLNIDDDVPWNSGGTYYALTGVKALDFQPGDPDDVTGYAGALFVSEDDNELYWRTTGGTNVQITDGATLNIAAFSGGIGGDYSVVTALLDYDDATDTYRFRQELSASVRQYAKIGVADIILREYDAAGDATVPTHAITIKSPDALAAAYSLTLPTGVPANQSLVQMSSAGELSASNTTTQPIEALDFYHSGTHQLLIPATMAVDPNGVHTRQLTASGAAVTWRLGASAEKITFPVPLKAGDVIEDFTVYILKNTNNTNTVRAQLYRFDINLGEAQVAIGSNNANAPATIVAINSAAANLELTEEIMAYIIVYSDAGVTPAADDILYAVVNYHRPL
jgi:hypothetical protein